MMARLATVLILVAVNLLARPALAQFKNGQQTVVLDLPRVSQHAVVTQRIGVTDVAVDYHRPAVDGRKIFGDLVAFGRVWRAGANDNTTLTVSDPVSIEGRPLQAGRYGVHMIPGPSEWTVILSRNAASWGSFSYDPKEDALRVTVKPTDAPFHELLTYEFQDVKTDGAVLALMWEKTSVRLAVAVDTKALALIRIREALRSLPGYTAEAWNDAAMWCLDNGYNYEEALKWADRSIQQDERFDNLDTKAQLLEAMGRMSDAKAAAAKAMAIANGVQLYGVGDRLLKAKRVDEASAVFAANLQQHPTEWIAWVGQAKGQAARGDRTAAEKSLREALARVPGEGGRIYIERLLTRLKAGRDLG